MTSSFDRSVSGASAAGQPHASQASRTEAGQDLVGARHAGGARVLIVDDEAEIQRAVRTYLGALGFAVEGASTGREGMDLVASWHPDVVILDLSLPDLDGVDVCRDLRTWSQVPIVVLSVRADDADKVTALELGADDYLTKPFSPKELAARVRVALRHAARGAGGREAQFESGGLLIDFDRRRVSVDGREIHLTPTEYEMLKYLAMNEGKVITHHTLLRAVWGPQYETEDHYLHVFIGQLRRKIEPVPTRPHYLLTEPCIGYRLRVPD